MGLGRQGFGCMPLSHGYGHADRAEALAVIGRAIDLGITFFDTADIYGMGENERLLGQAIRGRRDGLVIASKVGHRLDRATSGRNRDGRPEHIREAVEASLVRLGTDRIDLLFLHRLDPLVPVEDSVGALARLREEGKILGIGLCEVGADVLRRAQAVAPVAALQSEYSLWSREVENAVLPLTQALDIAFVAFSPLGRGFLAGADAASEGDRRVEHPRFQAEAAEANRARRARAAAIAGRLGISLAQLSLAWVLSKRVVPIPGTRHIAHLEDNMAANGVALDCGTIAELEALYPPGSTAGERFPEQSRP